MTLPLALLRLFKIQRFDLNILTSQGAEDEVTHAWGQERKNLMLQPAEPEKTF